MDLFRPPIVFLIALVMVVVAWFLIFPLEPCPERPFLPAATSAAIRWSDVDHADFWCRGGVIDGFIARWSFGLVLVSTIGCGVYLRRRLMAHACRPSRAVAIHLATAWGSLGVVILFILGASAFGLEHGLGVFSGEGGGGAALLMVAAYLIWTIVSSCFCCVVFLRGRFDSRPEGVGYRVVQAVVVIVWIAFALLLIEPDRAPGTATLQEENVFGPFQGRVVDATTDEPIAGAAAVVSWSFLPVSLIAHRPVSVIAHLPVSLTRRPDFLNAQTAVTDGEGRFEIPAFQPPRFILGTTEPSFSCVAPGYLPDSRVGLPRGMIVVSLQKRPTRANDPQRYTGAPLLRRIPDGRRLELSQSVNRRRREMGLQPIRLRSGLIDERAESPSNEITANPLSRRPNVTYLGLDSSRQRGSILVDGRQRLEVAVGDSIAGLGTVTAVSDSDIVVKRQLTEEELQAFESGGQFPQEFDEIHLRRLSVRFDTPLMRPGKGPGAVYMWNEVPSTAGRGGRVEPRE
jgi:hypothetical protein